MAKPRALDDGTSDLEGLSGRERQQLLRRLYCVHPGIAWRTVRPHRGRLTATCSHCGAGVSRAAFPKGVTR